MPSHNVQLDASGKGYFQFYRPPQTLTIINNTASSVNFRWKPGSDPVPLAANTQVEFEESEALETLALFFDSGPANGVLVLTWSDIPERIHF